MIVGSMKIQLPKDDSKYQWTNHVKGKMLYYGISASLIKRTVRFPKRKEEGVAPRTIAVMVPYGSPTPGKKLPYRGEVWVMYQELGRRPSSNSSQLTINISPKLRIISAWRYPGMSPIGKKIPIPDEIRQELEELIN